MSNQKSFTIIELLVVIAIVGLIASLVLVNIGLPAQRQRAKIAKTLEFSQSIQNALGSEAVGIWEFDEGSGAVANDRSGFGNNGTLYNFTPPYGYATDTPQRIVGSSPGKYALSFDGVNDYVDAGNGASLDIRDAITVEQWVKLTGPAPGYSGIFSKLNGAGSVYYGFHISMNTTAPYFVTRVNDSEYANNSAGSLTPNEWYHLVGTWDKSTGQSKVYLNGALKGTINTPTASLTGGNGNLRNGYGGAYLGLLDEVRIYGQALTIGQIQKHYAEGLEKRQNIAIK